MGASPTRRVSRRRALYAAAAALLIHAGLLGSMGLVHPGVMAPPPDERPSVELEILPPLTAATRLLPREALLRPVLATMPSPLQGLAAPMAPAIANAIPPGPPRPPSASYPGFFEGGLPGCGLEDIPLLNADEKVRCRNQIEVARQKRNQAIADAERAAKMQAVHALPPVDGIAPEKRAYYDAVAEASRSVREDFMKGLPARDGLVGGDTHTHFDMNVHAGCTMSFGVGVTKPVLHCPLAPPTGFLTEEARIPPP